MNFVKQLFQVEKTVINVTSLTGFSTTSYTLVIPTGVLLSNKGYTINALFDLPGVDDVVQTWVLSGVASSGSAGATQPDLIENHVSYASSARYLKLRARPGASTVAFECALSQSDMTGGSIVFTITKNP